MRLLLILLLLAPALAQSNERIYRHVQQAPPEAGTSVEALAAYLKQGLFTPHDQALGLYYWLGTNVAYDAESYLGGRTHGLDTSPASVLASRKTICDGYSRLFEAVGLKMGLEVVRISGDAKGRGGPGGGGHAWNAVKLGHGWVLVDATWGAGTVGDRFNPSYTTFYFATDPKVLVTTHFPDDPRWQLLPSPLSRAEFDALQPIKPSYSQRRPTTGFKQPPAGAAATAGSPPRTLTSYNFRGVKLVKPQQGTLQAGKTEEFYLKAAGADRIVVITGETSYTLPRGRLPGEFRGTVPLSSGTVKVMGDFTGGRLEGLLEYSVP